MTPISRRGISLDFDEYNGEIVHNPYGNAFLIRKRVGTDSYKTQLVSMSYYSAANSQIFKVIDMAGEGSINQCLSLSQNAYFEETPEDQIAITFICNSQLYLYRLCMRP